MDGRLASSSRKRKAAPGSRSRRSHTNSATATAVAEQEGSSNHAGGASASPGQQRGRESREKKATTRAAGSQRRLDDHRERSPSASPERVTGSKSSKSRQRSSKRLKQGPKLSPSPDEVRVILGQSVANTVAVKSRNHGPVQSSEEYEETRDRLNKSTNIDPSISKASAQPDEAHLALLRDAQAENAQLQARLGMHEATVAKQREAISQMHAQCSCTICLELAWRPHLLSPCGHIFCARCLLLWFKKPLPNELALPTYLTPEQRTAEEQRRTLCRQKLCPHCREKVIGSPAEVWMVKGLIESLEESVRLGQMTEQDLNDVDRFSDTKAATSQDQKEVRGEDLPAGKNLWGGIFDDRPVLRQPIFDEDDGVLRCVACASEVLRWQCTNPYCRLVHERHDEIDDIYDHGDGSDLELYDLVHGADYPDDEDDEWEDDDDDFIDDSALEVAMESSDEDAEFHTHPHEEEDNDDVGDQHRDHHHDDDDDDDDVLEVDGQGQPVSRPHRRVITSVSDSEDDGMQIVGTNRAHSPRQRHFSDDEGHSEDVEDDEDDEDRSEEHGDDEEVLADTVNEEDDDDDDDDEDLSMEFEPYEEQFHDATDEEAN